MQISGVPKIIFGAMVKNRTSPFVLSSPNGLWLDPRIAIDVLPRAWAVCCPE